MSIYTNDHTDPGGYGGQENGVYGNNFMFPYDDPAIVNPDELATFPKTINTGAHYHYESHLVSKRNPLREGKHITITDNHPDKNGFV